MNVIERSKFRDEEGDIRFMERLNATLDYGFSWYPKMQAQLTVTQRLSRVLGEEHVLVRNPEIPGVEEGEPFMILVSPQGVRLILALPVRGVFRAKDDEWLRFESRSRRFKPTRPNLQSITLNMLHRVQHLLQIQQYTNLPSEGVMIFTHPRTLIDSARPVTRVVSTDAIEYFAANLEQQRSVMTKAEVRNLVDAILYPQIPDPEVAALADFPPAAAPQPTDFSPSQDQQSSGSTLESLAEPETLVDDQRGVDSIFTEPQETTPPFAPTEFGDESFLRREDPGFAEIEKQLFQGDDVEEFEPTKPQPKRRLSTTQWIVVALLAVAEVVILVVFVTQILK